MFVLAKLRDRVAISLASRNRVAEVFAKLSRKYSNKVAPGIGLGICMRSVDRIHHYKVSDEKLVAKTDFTVLAFRFYEDELLHGRLAIQSAEGIDVELSFYGRIAIPKENMPGEFRLESTEYDGRDLVRWFWPYRNSKLYLNDGDTVRFKLKDIKSVPVGRIDEAGLGPTKWWEY